jgi:hypothetical protein
MAHIRPEVLAAIRDAQTIFRARGRPLTPAMVDELARGWLAARKEFDRAREITPAFWPIAELMDLCREAPESAWAVLERMLQLEPASWIELEVLAELQAVWERHPALVVARLPILVERYPNLRVILSGDRPFGMSTAFWAQVRVG